MTLKITMTTALVFALSASTLSFAKEKGHARYLSEIQDSIESKEAAKPKAKPKRTPAAGKTETTKVKETPEGSQIAFFELTPTIGTVSINDKSNFTLGLLSSFRVAEESELFFEPSVLVSFVSGDNDQNTAVFHLDAGARYDFIINGSAIVPFLKAAVGPSISSRSNVIVNGDDISDSYLNVFAGGGFKILFSPHIGGRLDTGITFQGTNPGLYLSGSVSLPL